MLQLKLDTCSRQVCYFRKGLKMLPTDMAGAHEDFDLNQSESSVRQVIRRWAQNLKRRIDISVTLATANVEVGTDERYW